MSTSQPENIRYLAEFTDGPLEGQTESRVLIDGSYEKRLARIALVDSLESTFWYDAIDDREVADELHVRYRFDAGDSDSSTAQDELDVRDGWQG